MNRTISARLRDEAAQPLSSEGRQTTKRELMNQAADTIESLQAQVEAAKNVPHLDKRGDYSEAFRLGHATALGKVTVAMSEVRRVRE